MQPVQVGELPLPFNVNIYIYIKIKFILILILILTRCWRAAAWSFYTCRSSCPRRRGSPPPARVVAAATRRQCCNCSGAHRHPPARPNRQGERRCRPVACCAHAVRILHALLTRPARVLCALYTRAPRLSRRTQQHLRHIFVICIYIDL